jgi:predicted SAM-dependent methyltransferase
MPNNDQSMGHGMQETPLKLHLGCGKKFIPGFVHIDVLKYDHVDYCQRVDELGNFATGSASLIYACHVLEHFSFQDTEILLKTLKVKFKQLSQAGVHSNT